MSKVKIKNNKEKIANLLLSIGCVNIDFKKQFTLTSGKKSPVYVDCRKLISFPKERDCLLGLRNGTWSGYSVGFDPTFITRSRFGISSDLSADAYRYSVKDSWKRMSHLKWIWC